MFDSEMIELDKQALRLMFSLEAQEKTQDHEPEGCIFCGLIPCVCEDDEEGEDNA